MALDRMKAAAQGVVIKAGVGYQAVASYGQAFDQANASPGDPLPCPHCFLKGAIGHLAAKPADGGFESAVCTACHEEIEWSVDE